MTFRQDENHPSLSASPLFHLHPTRRSDLDVPTKIRTFVRPIPLTAAVMTEVFLFFPTSLFILYLTYQLGTIPKTTRTKGPVLSLSQPQTSQHGNQKMATTTQGRILPNLAATDHLELLLNGGSERLEEREQNAFQIRLISILLRIE